MLLICRARRHAGLSEHCREDVFVRWFSNNNLPPGSLLTFFCRLHYCIHRDAATKHGVTPPSLFSFKVELGSTFSRRQVAVNLSASCRSCLCDTESPSSHLKWMSPGRFVSRRRCRCELIERFRGGNTPVHVCLQCRLYRVCTAPATACEWARISEAPSNADANPFWKPSSSSAHPDNY